MQEEIPLRPMIGKYHKLPLRQEILRALAFLQLDPKIFKG